MAIEHFISNDTNPDAKNEYSNCLYVCTRCSRARAYKPLIDDSGRRLLRPSRDAWGDHFILDGSEILPRKGDADAAYTLEAYDLNAPDKVRRRLFRKELLAARGPLIEGTPEKIDQLMRKAETCFETERERFFQLTSIAGELGKVLKNAREELSWYSAIPADAPLRCRCGDATYHSLPPWLERQMIDLP